MITKSLGISSSEVAGTSEVKGERLQNSFHLLVMCAEKIEASAKEDTKRCDSGGALAACGLLARKAGNICLMFPGLYM